MSLLWTVLHITQIKAFFPPDFKTLTALHFQICCYFFCKVMQIFFHSLVHMDTARKTNIRAIFDNEKFGLLRGLNTVENVILNSAICRVAWFKQATVSKLRKTLNLTWGRNFKDIFYCALLCHNAKLYPSDDVYV